MKNFIESIEWWKLVPVKFHPYTSNVRDCFFSLDCKGDELTRLYKELEIKLLDFFNEREIVCREDNKIVFECLIHGKTICFGFKDWTLNIGFSYADENERRK